MTSITPLCRDGHTHGSWTQTGSDPVKEKEEKGCVLKIGRRPNHWVFGLFSFFQGGLSL